MVKTKTKKSWYKRWWAIILFIVIGFAIIGSLLGDNSSNSTESLSSKDSCKSLIPERINLGTFWVKNADGEDILQYWSNRDTYLKEIITEPYYWNDGTLIIGESETISFRRGNREKENINLIYSTNVITYSKIPINEDGTIGKEIFHKFFLVLNPDDKTDEGYKVMQYKCCSGVSCDPRLGNHLQF